MSGEDRDSLTGLLSRRGFDAELQKAFGDFTEDSGIVALILIDLDRFKRINDALGYWAGDSVLKSVARTLQAVIPLDAVAGRCGGDEFVVLWPATTEPRAKALVRRIETAVGSLALRFEDRDIGPISVSTGLAWCPRDGRCADDVFRAADTALFRMKRGGG